MPRRIAVGTLNASTLDILNVIRQNASYEYQSQVPVITQATDIPKVGAVIYGTPALANQFLNALINRIAMVRVQSATFNNPYRDLKKVTLSTVRRLRTSLFPSLRWLCICQKRVRNVSSNEPYRM